MALKRAYILILFPLLLVSCTKHLRDSKRTPLIEINGKYLYKDELDRIIPKDANMIDSANIADRYIQKWATSILMYQNAKNNINSFEKIDEMVQEYRQSLIIHQYEQALIMERVDTVMTEKELAEFYEYYKPQLTLEENLIKGILLITPSHTPRLNEVRQWVQTADSKSLENIEKYSLRNAISYDYFMNEWRDFAEIIAKTPIETQNKSAFIQNNKFYETSDSTKHYFLKISESVTTGEVEPFETAKEKIASIILNKKKSDFIINFESSIYKDAIKSGEIKFIQNNK